MKNPDNYPPYQYLKQVLTSCPSAGLTYMQLWQHVDDNLRLKIKKNNIRNLFLCTPTKLKNDAMVLMREALVDMTETEHYLHFELTGWEDDDDVNY